LEEIEPERLTNPPDRSGSARRRRVERDARNRSGKALTLGYNVRSERVTGAKDVRAQSPPSP
jgi:hypothetical protein